MMVQSKRVTTVTQTTSDIAVRTQDGQVIITGSCSDGAKWEKVITPDDAVALWRCCMGEHTSSQVDICGTHDKLTLFCIDAEESHWYLVCSCDGQVLSKMNADQAMVFGWALKACATDALRPKQVSEPTESVTKELVLACVWVLSERSILTGDTTAEGADLIGGREQVFSSEKLARDALREFLRPLVNESETDSYWEMSDRNVDDVLDEILENEQKVDQQTSSWSYNGLRRSFEVTLSEHMSDQPCCASLACRPVKRHANGKE